MQFQPQRLNLEDNFVQSPKAPRRLRIRHKTTYLYDKAVQHSTHSLRLCPIHDKKQNVISHSINVNLNTSLVEFEDVFGNLGVRFEIDYPYKNLVIDAESIVELVDIDPFAFTRLPKRPMFPVVWMPWEQKMLGPYLQPMELPDTELLELFDYAIQFSLANKYDLMETLFAINLEIFRNYEYKPGATCNATTPYQVFTTKKGVCQDFAGLFIQIARLLGLPARYVCGYIYTGNSVASNANGDATHAWLQIYIPNVGWKGFDPTNGTLPCTDHVRTAYGRYFRDTAPTSGTLFSSATETMRICVEVSEEKMVHVF
jgi:transglutaminase-like putative cysteine protease